MVENIAYQMHQIAIKKCNKFAEHYSLFLYMEIIII